MALHFVEIFIVFGIWLNKVVNLVVWTDDFHLSSHTQWTLHWYAIAFDFVAIFGVLNSDNRPLSFQTNPKSSHKNWCCAELICWKKIRTNWNEALEDCGQWFDFVLGRLIFHNQAGTWHWINFNKHPIKLEVDFRIFSWRNFQCVRNLLSF